jgi:DDE superfamily endonuclease/Helix-turn-helix of DDE superfamily endonuclease
MYHTTGLTKDEILDLCRMVRSAGLEPGVNHWPPILGLYRSMVIALAYLRRNRVQAELAEEYGVSQPTISRAIAGIIPLLEKVLRKYIPTADELDDKLQYIVDGTLLPCWSWASHPELYSGKHKTTGMSVQVACDLGGNLAWISDPTNGNRHDSYCLSESEVLRTLDPGNWMGDKGYIGKGMITPIKKPAHRELLDWEKEFNTQINKVRYVIERTIANFKTWRIMHTDYRRPLATFTATISAVIGLHFYATG